MSSTSGALEAVEEILERGGDADDVLRSVVAVLHETAGYSWAGIFFVEEGELVLGRWQSVRSPLGKNSGKLDEHVAAKDNRSAGGQAPGELVVEFPVRVVVNGVVLAGDAVVVAAGSVAGRLARGTHCRRLMG